MKAMNLVIFSVMVKIGELIGKIFEEDILYDDWHDFYSSTFPTRGK
jgi:hypothetical protein